MCTNCFVAYLVTVTISILFKLSSQEFPDDLLEVDYVDPNDSHKKLHRSEVERRAKYYNLLEDIVVKGQHHPLALLSKSCLNNDPKVRPTAEQIVTALEDMEDEVEGPYGEFSKLDAVRQVTAMKAIIVKDVEVREKDSELKTQGERIKRLQKKLEHAQKVLIIIARYQVFCV